MATMTIMDAKSAESVYRAANARYDAQLAINARKIESVHASMRATINWMHAELNRAYIPVVIARYFESLDHTSVMAYDRTMRAWYQYLPTWCTLVHDAIEYLNDTMVNLDQSLVDDIESLAQLHNDRACMLPENVTRTIEHARSYVPVSNTVLSRSCRSFVVMLDHTEDMYRISIRTHDSQIKVYSSARMHNAACIALQLIERLIERKYMVADGESSAMVIDRITGTCTNRVMVDYACSATIDAIRKLARSEAKNVLPFERVKRSWYTIEHDQVSRVTMPQCMQDARSIVMRRSVMHGKHVQSSEYALSESVMNQYGISTEDMIYYELQLPRDTIRTRKDSHGELVSFEVQTLDHVRLYVIDRNDARIATMIERIKKCKLAA